MRKSRPRRIGGNVLELAPWLPAVLGVAALALLLISAVIRPFLWDDEDTPLPPPPPPLTLPGATDRPPPAPSNPQPDGPPAASGSVPEGSAPTASRTVPVGRTSTVPPPRTTPPAPPVTGRYEILDSYPDSFIGQVLITNSPGADRNWTVTLTFPSGAGELRTSWLESLPQPTLTRSGTTYTWRSTTPLAAGASGGLRFHFEGTRRTPAACVTNGRACQSTR